MAVVEELIRVERTGEVSFGNFELEEKAKVDNFEYNGDIYKVKTCKEITKLEKNEIFVYESVPGTAVIGFVETDGGVKFTVEGKEDAQITLELEDEVEYEITINGEDAGVMKTNLGGKLTIGVVLEADTQAAVIVNKK